MNLRTFGIFRFVMLLDEKPFTLIRPASGSKSKYINRMRVVLPEPVGPIKKENSPSSMVRLKLLTPEPFSWA
jgi:hypothetical protein